MNAQDDRAKAKTKALRDYVDDHIDDGTKTLLRLAWWDLWHGPFYADNPPEPDVGWETWPGFSEAVAQINDGLINVPRTLYIDLDALILSEAAPEGTWEHDPEHPDADEEGDVWYEPELDRTLRLEWHDIKRLLWSELATYLE